MTTLTLRPEALLRSRAFNPHSLVESLLATPRTASNYPPYNIEQMAEDRWRVTLAVAGFGLDDMAITVRDRMLVVEGKRPADEAERTYLHRGIGLRDFTHTFRLIEHVEVTGATMQNGLLSIELERIVPEAQRPKTIPIRSE